MGHEDFRGIGRAAQEALRRRALWLIEHEGLGQGEVVLLVGVQRQTVNLWVKRRRERGEDGVLDGRRVSPRRGAARDCSASVCGCQPCSFIPGAGE